MSAARRRRILIVTPWYPTDASPESGVFVAREAAALADAHDVRVLHLDWSRRSDGGNAKTADGVAVRRVSLRRANPFDYARARRIVRRSALAADILHTHALTGLAPWLFGRPAPVPWVHSEHWSAITSPDTLNTLHRAALLMLRPVLRRPDVVLAECERLAAALREVRPGPVAIVPCVIPPVDELVEWPSDGIHLVGVGGLIDRKDPLLAVDVLAELRRRGHDAHLTWVGDGPLRDRVTGRARDQGVAAQVTLTGVLDSRGVSAALDAARLFLLPTKADNFCVVAAEALTHGRPIVSGAETGAVDYADEAVSRFVVDRSAGAYADAVDDLLAGTQALSVADVAATVEGRFAPAAIRTALDAIYARAEALHG